MFAYLGLEGDFFVQIAHGSNFQWDINLLR
jgi:hypothetical protein